MGEQFIWSEPQTACHEVDVAGLAERLDRADILLLKEFYVTGRPYPNDTLAHVLRLLADKLHRTNGPLSKLSYSAIRYRLENLVALGLLGKIDRTNPVAYRPLDEIAPAIRRIILLFAADFVDMCRPQGVVDCEARPTGDAG